MDLKTYHDIVKSVPRKAASRKHQRRNERCNRSTERVAGLQKTRYLVGVRHVAHPRTPCCINEAISEAYEKEHDDENGVRRMECEDDECDQMTGWSDDCDATLSESDVHGIVRD